MAGKKLDLVVAMAENRGIGLNGGLPWPRLPTDMKFMVKKTKETEDPKRQNAVIMGRRTWDSVPTRLRPLKERYNIVLSSRNSSEVPGAHLVCSSLSDAITCLQTPPLSERIESVFILGGSSVYQEAMNSPQCNKVYMTEILAEFPSDTFFPPLNPHLFRPVEDCSVPQGVIEESGVCYRFRVYQKTAAE